MTSLASSIIEAHGGLARWRQFDTVSADLVQGGALWTMKGQAGTLDRTTVTVGLRSEWASHFPFGPGRLRSRFAPDRVAIEDAAGTLRSELLSPRASFAGHTLETTWSDLQLAYFAGCAMWTYLNMPFVLAAKDVETEELTPWVESGETWRRLRVRFPAEIATHSAVQTIYVGDDGLLRRHDYDVEIAGSTPGAHYVDDYTEVSGIKMPTKRRIVPRQPDGQSSPDLLVVSIDLANLVFGVGRP